MTTTNYLIRTMSRNDLELVSSWTKAESWNPGANDITPFQIADPEGFFVGVLDGKPVASISAVKYSSDYSFIGLFIVLPEYRGKHLGFDGLWKHALKRLSTCKTVGLDGVLAQQENYKRSGFVLAHPTIRYSGKTVHEKTHLPMTDLRIVPFEQWAAYDNTIFPSPRPSFLAAWLTIHEHQGLAVIKDGIMCGYGFIRPAAQTYRIGPLFANDTMIAEQLYLGLCQKVSANTPISMDIATTNLAAVELANKYGLDAGFNMGRMYCGPFPKIDMARMYGVHSVELG